ncbi:MAG TPA: PCMD domain-containing protein [Bacteroidia bacterium]|jgi:hypothetical protein|nr:PCMD domain-containing protein [Bacteroidia bacterium]
MIKKIHICVIAGCLFASAGRSQTIPNSGFESWSSGGNYEDPQGWGTLNSQTAILGIKTVTKATAASDIHGGTYAIKLVTAHIGVPYNMNVPGLAATGTINASTKAIDGGFAYTMRPVSLSGWYKYTPAGKDTASVEVTVSQWDTLLKKRITVGHAKFLDTAHVSTYTSFTVQLNYSSTALPDTGVIVLLSSQQNSSVVNSTLFVDDLSFTLPAGINEDQLNQKITLSPNPASDVVKIDNLPFNATGIQIYDACGKMVLYDRISAPFYELGLEGISQGLYFYRVTGMNQGLLKQGKLVIRKP